MGYQKIKNLYQDTRILEICKEVFALEKVHGTSAHVAWDCRDVRFFSGGAKHADFAALFDAEDLAARFAALGHGENCPVTVYGEAYGGKMQKMSEVYGKELRFIVFEVSIGGTWLAVPDAANVADKMSLEFVPYERGPATLEWVDAQRDLPSRIAKRRGLGDNKVGEGVVLRPLIELTASNGARIMAKHKTPGFRETKKPREVDAERLEVLANARAIAEEWVIPNRLEHVLDQIRASVTAGEDPGIEHTGEVVRAMLRDVKAESEGEVEWSREAERAVGTTAANLFKAHLRDAIGSRVS